MQRQLVMITIHGKNEYMEFQHNLIYFSDFTTCFNKSHLIEFSKSLAVACNFEAIPASTVIS